MLHICQNSESSFFHPWSSVIYPRTIIGKGRTKHPEVGVVTNLGCQSDISYQNFLKPTSRRRTYRLIHLEEIDRMEAHSITRRHWQAFLRYFVITCNHFFVPWHFLKSELIMVKLYMAPQLGGTKFNTLHPNQETEPLFFSQSNSSEMQLRVWISGGGWGWRDICSHACQIFFQVRYDNVHVSDFQCTNCVWHWLT